MPLLLRPLDDLLNRIRWMLVDVSGKLIPRIPMRDQACDLSAPTQMGLRKIIRGRLEMPARGIDAAHHDLIVQH
jgi:hypothetical protein